VTDDVIEAINQQVAEAVSEHKNGEDVQYGVGLTVVPNAQGQPQPVIVILLSIPGSVIGSRLTATHLTNNIMVEPTTPEAVRQMIEQLLQARSEQLTQAAIPQNGHNPQSPLASGLIDPRQ